MGYSSAYLQEKWCLCTWLETGKDDHIKVGATYSSIQQVFPEGLLCAWHCSRCRRYSREQDRQNPCPHRAKNKTSKLMVIHAWEKNIAEQRAGDSSEEMAILNWVVGSLT